MILLYAAEVTIYVRFALVDFRELYGLSSLNPKKIDFKMHLRVLYNLVSSDIREMAFMHSLFVCGNRLGAIMMSDTIFFPLQYGSMKIKAMICTEMWGS